MTSVVAACVTALAAILSVVATYYLAKRRELEAEWRKLRLERYQDFLKSFSTVIRSGASQEDRARYADAVNNLTLVAPSSVLRALYAFQDAVGQLSGDTPQAEAEAAASGLVHAMRIDVRPGFAGQENQMRLRFLGF
jgi:hypothetical protein